MSKVTFTLTRKEARACVSRICSAKLTKKIDRLTLFIMAGIALLAWLRFAVFQTPQWSNFGTILLPPLLILAGMVSVRFVTASLEHHGLQVSTPQTVTIEAGGLYITKDKVTTQTRWNAIIDIRNDADYILFLLKNGVASIIPKRAFRSPDATRDFLSNAAQWWRSTDRTHDTQWTSSAHYRITYRNDMHAARAAGKKRKDRHSDEFPEAIMIGFAFSFMLIFGGATAQVVILIIPLLLPLLKLHIPWHFMAGGLGLFVLAIYGLSKSMTPHIPGLSEMEAPMVVALIPDGVVENRWQAETLTAWSAVRSIQHDEQSIYFQLSRKSLLIPRNAFTDNVEAERFLQAALAYRLGELPSMASNEAWPPPPDRSAKPISR